MSTDPHRQQDRSVGLNHYYEGHVLSFPQSQESQQRNQNESENDTASIDSEDSYYLSDSDPETQDLDPSEYISHTSPFAAMEQMDQSFREELRELERLPSLQRLNAPDIFRGFLNRPNDRPLPNQEMSIMLTDPLTTRTLIQDLKKSYSRETVVREVQPADAYSSSLNLEFQGVQRIDTTGHPPFMSNVAAPSNIYPILFLADGTKIRVFSSDGPTGVLEPTTVLQFDTEPSETTDAMREAANMPGRPHNITHMIATFLRDNDHEVLVASCDNGRVLVWDTRSIYARFKSALRLAYIKRETPFSRHSIFMKSMPPSAMFQLPKSAWGLAIHKRLNLLAASCNEGRVYIFSLDQVFSGDSRATTEVYEPLAISPFLPHNIPDIEFIEPDPSDISRGLYYDDAFYLMATSISGHVAMWEFFLGERLKQFTSIAQERLNQVRGVDANVFSREVMLERQRQQQHQSQPHRQSSFAPGSAGSTSSRRSRSGATGQTYAQRNNSNISLSDLMEFVTESPALPAMQEEDEDDLNEDFNGNFLSGGDDEDVSLLGQLRLDFSGEKIDPLYLHIPFEGGRWMSVEQLRQDGWSISGVSERDFLEVDSLYELSGNEWFTEANVFKQQSSSIHKLYAIPGLNRKNKEVGEDAQGMASPGHSLGVNGDVIPLNQEFVDFAMRLSYFVILTKPIHTFYNTWRNNSDGEESHSEPEISSDEEGEGGDEQNAANTTPIRPLQPQAPRSRDSSFLELSLERALTPQVRYARIDHPALGIMRAADSALGSEREETTQRHSNNTVTRVSRPVSPHSRSRRASSAVSASGVTSAGAAVEARRLPSLVFMHAGESGSGSHTSHSDTYLDSTRKQHRDWYILKRVTDDLASTFSQNLLKHPPFDKKFVILTSKKSLHLCRAESLLCNASQGDLFMRETYLSSSLSIYDRLSISILLPGVNAVIVATPLGAVSLLRMVKHKNVFSLRQEFVFPVHEMISTQQRPHAHGAESSGVVITGLAATPVYRSDQDPRTIDPHDITRYRVTITYRRGLVFTYTVSRPGGGNPIIEESF